MDSRYLGDLLLWRVGSHRAPPPCLFPFQNFRKLKCQWGPGASDNKFHMDYNSQIVHCNYAEHFNPTSICVIWRRLQRTRTTLTLQAQVWHQNYLQLRLSSWPVVSLDSSQATILSLMVVVLQERQIFGEFWCVIVQSRSTSPHCSITQSCYKPLPTKE